MGDIKRFPSVKQLTAFAGLDSSVYESGTFKANQLKRSQGKPGKVTIVTSANKLLRVIYGIRNSRTPFCMD
uniref:transposase n=1 Tax=Cohnella herbarum TaxID=2728023 RepID=UPI0035C24F37